jgi:ribosomal protein L14
MNSVRFDSVPLGAKLVVADNAYSLKYVKMIGVFKKGSAKRRLRHAQIGNHILVSQKKKMYNAILIRSKKGIYRSLEGRYYRFQDNAVVMIDTETKKLRGTRVKGPIPREVLELYPNLGTGGAKVL